MTIKELANIPEEQRIIIRSSVNRIQDIANELLFKNRIIKSINENENEKIKNSIQEEDFKSLELFTSLLESIVTEKRMQYRSELGIEIEYLPNKNSYGIFGFISPKNFKRVISNAINNSVEAFGNKGRVFVELSSDENNAIIKIKDTGKGISPDILEQLGKKIGETHGKEEGNGLGLYHARVNVESWKGKLFLESEVGKGTTLNIVIPKQSPPQWFVPELNLIPSGHIVVLDDDSSIHQIWERRFNNANIKDYQILLHHFSLPGQVEDWVSKNKDLKNVVFLFDFELLGQEKNGLDVIEKLSLAKNSMLVTSRFEEKFILDRCQKLGVRLIPKSMAENVPIIINIKKGIKEELPHKEDKIIYDYLYLDDDKILRRAWESSAKRNGIKLLTISTTKNFDEHKVNICKDTKIYIDRELGDNEPKGEIFAKTLYEQGFKNLYLATGHRKEYFPQMDWIIDIIEKDAPWDRPVKW